MLTTAFNSATAGLQTMQTAITVASQNIANAGTAGYVKRTVTTSASGAENSGVAMSAVSRNVTDASLRQLRLETSSSAFTSIKADILSRLDKLYGKPGASTALDGRMNAFTQALQGLAANPASAAVRNTVLSVASILAGHIGSIASNAQELRASLEKRLAIEVSAANELLTSIASLNSKAAAAADDSARAGLLDQRDQQITQLSSYFDVNVQNRGGTVTLMTTSGISLVEGGLATRLSFKPGATPGSGTSTGVSELNFGAITATTPGGGIVDLSSGSALRSGSIAAALELRDEALPRAGRHLDELALGLARSLTDKSAIGVENGSGIDLSLNDLTKIRPGNVITITVGTGAQARDVFLVASTLASRNVDASAPASSSARAQTFTLPAAPATALGYADAISAALSAVSPGLSAASSTQGKVTLSGAGIRSVAAAITQPKSASDLSGAYPSIPLFVDASGNSLITGALDGIPQRVGLAQRLSVNPALIRDSSPLAAAAPAASAPSRPQFMYDALTSAKQTFSSLIGTGHVPYVASVATFAQDIIAAQGSAAASAKTIDEVQGVALRAAQERFSTGTSVSVDEEMSRLLALQTAYAANARVLMVVREMLDTLLKI
ncbi:flagellar hook-associated protein FlgK [Boseaceae bacterium BT-24-1]|nr:flagellar hook-associated protein FlgK [Boseaceae bacterium BT-24-1]